MLLHSHRLRMALVHKRPETIVALLFCVDPNKCTQSKTKDLFPHCCSVHEWGHQLWQMESSASNASDAVLLVRERAALWEIRSFCWVWEKPFKQQDFSSFDEGGFWPWHLLPCAGDFLLIFYWVRYFTGSAFHIQRLNDLKTGKKRGRKSSMKGQSLHPDTSLTHLPNTPPSSPVLTTGSFLITYPTHPLFSLLTDLCYVILQCVMLCYSMLCCVVMPKEAALCYVWRSCHIENWNAEVQQHQCHQLTAIRLLLLLFCESVHLFWWE